jgi:hypothetical protein
MIYKYTSVREIIAKVFTDLNLQEEAQRISDMIEWCGEAMEKIGSYNQYILKVAGKAGEDVLTVDNYQAKLPDDFHSLVQVAYSQTAVGPFYPMRYSGGSFDTNRRLTAAMKLDDSNYLDNPSALITLNDIIWTMTLFDLSYQDSMAKLQAEPQLAELMRYILSKNNITDINNVSDGNTSFTEGVVFTINNNYIKTNMQTGYIVMAYLAMPTDEEGYPKIPDNSAYKEAIYWYITMKLLYPKWVSGQIKPDVYYHAELKWQFYRKQAYAEGMMPDVEQLESIKNLWLRIIPTISEHDTFFSNLDRMQQMYTHSYKGRGFNKNI